MPDRNYNFEPVGDAVVSSNGQLHIPKAARDASGIVEGTGVLVFVESTQGFVLLTHQPLADDLIEAAARAAKTHRAN